MKKFLSIICVLLAVFSLISCKSQHIHEFGEWEIEDATCNQDGIKRRYCSCGETQHEVITATGHSINKGICTVCKAIDDPCVALSSYLMDNGQQLEFAYLCGKTVSEYNVEVMILFNINTDQLGFMLIDSANNNTSVTMSLDLSTNKQKLYYSTTIAGSDYTVEGYIYSDQVKPDDIYIYGMSGKVPSIMIDNIKSLFRIYTEIMLETIPDILNETQLGVTMQMLGFDNY